MKPKFCDHLFVLVPPEVTLYPTSVYVNETEILQLECSANGDPPVNIDFIFETFLVQNSSRSLTKKTTIFNKGLYKTIALLQIFNASIADGGEVICRCENELDVINKSAEVIVNGMY